MLPNLKNLLEEYNICKRCLGRVIFTKITINLGLNDIDELSDSLRGLIVENDQCMLCSGIIEFSIELFDKINFSLKKIEFSSFMVGIILSVNNYDDIFSKYGLNGFSLKQVIAHEISERISLAQSKQVNKIDPELTVIVDLKFKPRFSIQIKSLYILGKYKKLVRGIPQTKWPCTHCKGKGCISCSNTGQQYPNSVESVVSGPFNRIAKNKNSSFHGAGREDIDALMLGTGRPFVLELKNPYVRTFDLNSLMTEINLSDKVHVTNLRFCDKNIIKLLKSESSSADKIYHATIKFEKTANNDIIEGFNNFGQNVIILKQRTPTRVSHRRADLIRDKKIFSVKLIKTISDLIYVLEIKAQGGAYIKEFISGDDGRTIPSVSSLIGIQVKCIELDVIKVDDKGIF